MNRVGNTDTQAPATPVSEAHRRACLRSRRGLLELDLLLLPFAQAEYAVMNEQEQRAYDRLLLEDDVVLIDWLKGISVGDDSEAQAVIDRIRSWHA